MRQWIAHITAASLLAAMAMALTPKGRVRQVTRLVCGLVCALAVAGPLIRLDTQALTEYLSEYEQWAGQLASQVREEEKMQERTYIEERCRAYIWGKADERGLAPADVSVTVRWDEDGQLWLPWEAAVDAPFDGGLAAAIEADLGVPVSRQRWRTDG